MKVNINNKELDIYDTDDNSITKLSIAKSLNTLPKYLFFKNPYSNTSENNEIVDILNILQEGEIKDKYIQTIKDFIKNRRKYDISVNTIEEIDIIRDILFVILCYNKELSDIINTSDNIDTLLFSFREDQYKYIIQMMMQIDDSLDRKKLESEKFFKDFLEEYKKVKEDIDNEKKVNAKKLENFIELEKEVLGIKTDVSQFTVFKTEEKYTDITYKTDFNLIEIFDKIKLSEKAVYCNFNDFHKIYNNFTPPNEDNWIQSSENVIKLKVNNKKLVSDINDDRKYKTVEIFKLEEGNITIRFEYLETDSTINYEKFVNLIFKTLDLEYNTLLSTELVRNIKGYFYIKSDDFDFIDFIFADMTMNEPSFKRISINEKEKTTKDKVEIPLKFFHHQLGYVTCNINKEIKLDNTDSYLSECLKESSIEIPLNSQYIKLHIIKARNEEAVNEFKNYIVKMFILYKNKLEYYKKDYDRYYGENYVNEYVNTYIIKKLARIYFIDKDTNKNIQGDKIDEPEKLKYILKRVRKRHAEGRSEQTFNFRNVLEYILEKYNVTLKILDRLKDYNKQITEYDKSKGIIRFNCNKQVKVKDYIESNDISKVEKYKDFIDDETTIKFKLNEEQSFIISCDHHPQERTIIWKENPFPSKSDIPLLPCCSKTGKKKTKREIERDLEKEFSISRNIIETNKICSVRQLGVLPDNINNLLNIISPGESFFRTGSIRTRESLIYCILSALYQSNITKEDVKEAKNKLSQNIEKGKLRIGLVKQECYDMNNEQILSYFKEDKYLDPNLLYRFFEEYYKCNIITFTDGEDKKGRISIPRYSKNHIRFEYNKDLPFIFIYENNGTQFPILEYPQCELIVLGKKTQKDYNIVNIFNPREYEFIDRLMQFYNNINLSYYLTTKVKTIKYPFIKEKSSKKVVNYLMNKRFEILSQSINAFGKTILLDIRDVETNNEFHIFTEPIPPINVVIKRYEKYKIVNYKYMKYVLDAMSGVISGKVVFKGMCVEVLFNINNINCSFRTEEFDERKLNVPVKNDESIINILKLDSEKESNMETIDAFVTNKKLARNLNEFIIYLFSKYLDDRNIKTDINKTHVEQFISENIGIDRSSTLELSKFYSLNFEDYNQILVNGKLLIPSKSLIKRIIFSLEFIIQRDVNKLINYHTKKRMDNFFVNLSDFSIIPGQVTLYKEQSVLNYINDKINKNREVISESIILNKTEPYFFSNNLIQPNVIFLAQRTETLQKACYVLYNWYKNGCNKGPELYEDISKTDYNERKDYSTSLEKNLLVYSYTNTFDIKIIAKVNDKIELYRSAIVVYKYDNNKIDYLCILELN